MKYVFEARAFIEADSLEEAEQEFSHNYKNFEQWARGEEMEEGTQFVKMVDDLDERAQTVKEEVAQDFIDWLKNNELPDDFDEYYQDRGADIVSEFADSNTPIYNKGIDDIYYLRDGDVEKAYQNAGFGDGSEDNHKQVAIYCYLSEAGHEGLRELEDVFNDKKEKGKKELIDEVKTQYELSD